MNFIISVLKKFCHLIKGKIDFIFIERVSSFFFIIKELFFCAEWQKVLNFFFKETLREENLSDNLINSTFYIVSIERLCAISNKPLKD